MAHLSVGYGSRKGFEVLVVVYEVVAYLLDVVFVPSNMNRRLQFHFQRMKRMLKNYESIWPWFGSFVSDGDASLKMKKRKTMSSFF